MTYYENAVHARWLASQEACDKLPSGRVYNITNGEHRTLRQHRAEADRRVEY